MCVEGNPNGACVTGGEQRSGMVRRRLAAAVLPPPSFGSLFLCPILLLKDLTPVSFPPRAKME